MKRWWSCLEGKVIVVDEIKRWLRVIGVPGLCLAAGFIFGLLAHGVRAPVGRFRMDSNNNVLDSKTGQYCIPEPGNADGLPNCLDLYRKY